ncbi:MAG: MFS transporter [Alphaproteobacteria bacterium]|nr:MFS transporter [Alphaproteobacteria bacterium]
MFKGMPRGIVALGFVSMFMDISSEIIHSLLPLFMTSVLGVSALSVGIVEGIAESTASIVKIFSGSFSDWIGKRKPLLLAGYGLSTLTKPLFPLAHSLETVLLARFADRIGKGIRVAPRDALVADITPPHERGAAYGLRQTMDTVGAFTGPALAILLMLATADNFRFVFSAALLPALVVMLILLFAIREPQKKIDGKKPFPLQKEKIRQLPTAFWQVTALGAVLTLARFSEAFLILRGDSLHLDAAFAPAILIVMNVIYALSAWPVGALSDRIGKTGLLAAGIALLIAADLILAFTPSLPLMFLGVALWGLHMGMTQGIITAFIADQAPEDLRGTAFGINNLLTGGALLLASVLAGALWKEGGPAMTFVAGAVFSALALSGMMVWRHALKIRPVPGL